jgi:hypothetical protein
LISFVGECSSLCDRKSISEAMPEPKRRRRRSRARTT